MEIKKVPVKVAAYILGKSEQFIRCGLRYGSLNFSTAKKLGVEIYEKI